MKKISFITFLTFLMLFSININAQKFAGLDKSPMDAAAFPSSHRVSDKLIKIVYGRPQLKGRSVSDLAPNDKVWRTGANEAPQITFYTDMKLRDVSIKAGTYSLLTIPGEKEWTIILSSDINVWGAYSYKKDNDVVRTLVPVSSGSDSLEAFSIAFEEAENGANMYLGWDKIRVSVPFTK